MYRLLIGLVFAFGYLSPVMASDAGPLHDASKSGNKAEIIKLLEQGANIDELTQKFASKITSNLIPG